MNLDELREQRIGEELERNRLRSGVNARDDAIITAITSAHGAASVYLVVSQTPEQSEDIVVVLVDDVVVARVETSRSDAKALVEFHTPLDFERELRGNAAITFQVARRLARRLLAEI